MLQLLEQDKTGDNFQKSAANSLKFLDTFYVDLHAQGSVANTETIAAIRVSIVETGRQIKSDGVSSYSPMATAILENVTSTASTKNSEGSVSLDNSRQVLIDDYVQLSGSSSSSEITAVDSTEALVAASATLPVASSVTTTVSNVTVSATVATKTLDNTLSTSAQDIQTASVTSSSSNNFNTNATFNVGTNSGYAVGSYYDSTSANTVNINKNNLSITSTDNGATLNILVPSTGVSQLSAINFTIATTPNSTINSASTVSNSSYSYLPYYTNVNGVYVNTQTVTIGGVAYSVSSYATADKDFYSFYLYPQSSPLSSSFIGYLEGYQGNPTPVSLLPTTGISVYATSAGSGYAINWATGKVYGNEYGSLGGITAGSLNRSTGSANLSYSTSGYTGDLTFYGGSAPEVLAGVTTYSASGSTASSFLNFSFLASNAVNLNAPPADNETWQGYGIAGTTAYTTKMTYIPSTGLVTGQFTDSSANTVLATSATSTNAYVSKDYFGASSTQGQFSTGDYYYNNLDNTLNATNYRTIDYDYLTWGIWSSSNTTDIFGSQSANNTNYWLAGRLTSNNDIPTTGTATYTGASYGTMAGTATNAFLAGTVTLNADFANRTLSGTMNNTYTTTTSTASSLPLTISANWATGVNSLTGTLSGSGWSGTLNANFFGSQAAEVGGVWQATNTTTSAAYSKASGIFAAKR